MTGPQPVSALRSPAHFSAPSPVDAALAARVRVELRRGADEWAALADAHEALFARTPTAPVERSRTWMDAWLEAGAARGMPAALTAWDGERLVGLLALTIRRVGGVRIAQPISDGPPTSHGGLLLEPGALGAVAPLAAALRTQRAFDLLAMSDVCSDDQAAQRWLAALADDGCTVRRVPRTVCLRARLGPSLESLLATKTTKARKNIKYENNRLHKRFRVALDYFPGRAVDAGVLERLLAVQRDSWMTRRNAVMLERPLYRRLVLNLAQADRLDVWIVRLDEQDAAFQIATRAHGRRIGLMIAFRLKYAEYSVGKWLTAAVLEACCASGVEEFDFGQGEAEYKRFWSNDEHHVERAFVGRGPLGALAARGLAAAWEVARQPRVRAWISHSRRWLRSWRRKPQPVAPAPREEPEP
jgi:CelD/BcsL family acetyltransferase involved in cellulose biosynthesis